MVSLRSESTDMERPHSRPRVPHSRPSRAVAPTSRRGRARSPAVSGGRMEENPSSVAAAAATAAKAFSSGRSAASAGGRDDRSTSSGYAPPPPPGYEAGYPPPHKWPGGDPSKRGSSRMHYPPRGYGPPPPGYAPGAPPGYPPPHHEAYDRRYHRGDPHGRGPPPPGHDPRSRYPVDYRYHKRGAGPTTPPKGARGGTSLVLGGATPIHVPKTAAPPPPPAPAPGATGPPERPTRASAASVFRGRSDAAPPALAEDEPSKILLSLRTPSTSFEEKKEADGTTLNLSPDDPPKILSSTQQQRAVDMFEKSPDGTRSTTHIDMNASFTLFNQSFDSFGENYLDSTLHTADSFGMNRTGSLGGPRASGEDPPGPSLQPNLSNAGLQANLSSTMLGPSASEQMTIGYSPVNSFGNPAQSPKRSGSGSMMVLGGPEHRSNSPTQVLGMYRTYSGSRGPPPPRMEEPPYRGGNYGGYRGPPPPGYDPYGRPPPPHLPPPPAHQEGHSDRMPPFYVFLCKYRGAFTGCSFLLPGLKAALLEAPNQDDAYPQQPYEQPLPQDIEVARRRVESSVCAFGGNHGESNASSAGSKDAKQTDTTSIFRATETTPNTDSATVTPSSSVASPPRNYSRAKAKYEEVLSGRYYENESRLSWEFEENPPVEVSDEESADKDRENSGRDSKNENKDQYDLCKPVDGDDKRSAPSPQPKMKYRCKLCGQPKQNHTCPYQQSLARSIGVMVYPAVNAFTAAEPGTIAPALSEMNNFVDTKDPNLLGPGETPPQPRPTPERTPRSGPSSVMASPKQVTPEQMRSSPSPAATPKIQNKKQEKRGTKRSQGGNAKDGSPGGSDAADDQGDLLFVESMELKPQQLITVAASLSSPDAFTYSTLPLPYAQRKRLSDNLFSLSNEVPRLTDECAAVLREAREKDMWDMAVAELITQVLVVTRCSDGDHRFEGLSQYLLTLGISC